MGVRQEKCPHSHREPCGGECMATPGYPPPHSPSKYQYHEGYHKADFLDDGSVLFLLIGEQPLMEDRGLQTAMGDKQGQAEDKGFRQGHRVFGDKRGQSGTQDRCRREMWRGSVYAWTPQRQAGATKSRPTFQDRDKPRASPLRGMSGAQHSCRETLTFSAYSLPLLRS